MPPSGAFESEGWIEAQTRISHALDNLRTDRKQQTRPDLAHAQHAQEALERGATREQIANALGMSEHASPEAPRRHGRLRRPSNHDRHDPQDDP
jgi:hypothetical protein